MSGLEPTAEQFAALAARPADEPVVMGDGEKPWWDAILVVEYPTSQAFIEMVATAEYARVRERRAAALDRGDLIATSSWSVAPG